MLECCHALAVEALLRVSSVLSSSPEVLRTSTYRKSKGVPIPLSVVSTYHQKTRAAESTVAGSVTCW